MRTRIRSLPASAPTNSNKEPPAPPIARLPRAAAAFERRCERPATLRLIDLVKAGKRYADWFLRSGTTTVEAKSGYGLTLEDELKILRAIKQLDEETPLSYVPTFLGAHDIPSEYKSRRQMYVNLVINEMLPRVAEEKLAEYCDVFCEEDVFTTDEAVADSFRRALSRTWVCASMRTSFHFPAGRSSPLN